MPPRRKRPAPRPHLHPRTTLDRHPQVLRRFIQRHELSVLRDLYQRLSTHNLSEPLPPNFVRQLVRQSGPGEGALFIHSKDNVTTLAAPGPSPSTVDPAHELDLVCESQSSEKAILKYLTKEQTDPPQAFRQFMVDNVHNLHMVDTQGLSVPQLSAIADQMWYSEPPYAPDAPVRTESDSDDSVDSDVDDWETALVTNFLETTERRIAESVAAMNPAERHIVTALGGRVAAIAKTRGFSNDNVYM